MTESGSPIVEIEAHDAIEHRRLHSRYERWADAIVHIAGLSAGLVGSIILVILAARHDDAPRLASVLIYGFGLVAMLGASAAYNLAYHSRFRSLLRRLDHSAIFLMIAGTYTPLMTQILGGLMALVSTLAVWATALGGISLKVFIPRWFERVGVGFYLALGWGGILICGPFIFALPASALWTLVAGGLLYTAGVIFHVWEKLPYQNAIWHSFVLAAAGCHWVAILTGVVLAPA